MSQGELYWLDAGEPRGSEVGYVRPVVVIQSDLLNELPYRTVITCGITSNIKRGTWTGNVTLAESEGGLSRPSVVEVANIVTVNTFELSDRIGQLSPMRLEQVLRGVRLAIARNS